MSSSAPEPRSSTTIAPCACAVVASAAGSGASVNPSCRKFDGWTRRTSRALPAASTSSKSATRVRFVVPTSTSFAPARRTISGMRTPPPISTSSPRLTATPPRPASPTESASAAALFVTTSASSAPVSATRWSSASRYRRPRRPVARSSSRNSVPAAASAAARIAASGHGARPRFVCTITPVPLSTRVGPAPPSNAASRARTSAARSSGDRASPASATASRSRSSSTTSRASATSASASRSPACGRTTASTRSTLGGLARDVSTLTRRSSQAAIGQAPAEAVGRTIARDQVIAER